MSRVLWVLLGMPLLIAAVTMIMAPGFWYERFPGVAERGAFNAHFVRDLGCAFLVAACSFLSGAIRGRQMLPAIVGAAAFLALHASIHAWESLTGLHPVSRAMIVADFALVYAPALLALATVLFMNRASQADGKEPGA